MLFWCFFFFKQKTAYEMRISDWSSDVCSSDLSGLVRDQVYAAVFGAGPAMDAFVVAFRILNFMRRLSAEGSFSMAFVPVLAEDRKSVVEGTSVSVRVDLGGRRIIKKKTK